MCTYCEHISNSHFVYWLTKFLSRHIIHHWPDRRWCSRRRNPPWYLGKRKSNSVCIHQISYPRNPSCFSVSYTHTAYSLLLLVSVAAAAGTTHRRPTPARSTSTRPLPPLSSSSWPLASVSILAKQPCLAHEWVLRSSAHRWGW